MGTRLKSSIKLLNHLPSLHPALPPSSLPLPSLHFVLSFPSRSEHNFVKYVKLILWAYDLVKIAYRSHKRSHKLNGIRVGRSRMFPFLPIPITTRDVIQWKLGCRSRKQKQKTQPIARPGIEHCHWFIVPFLLVTPTMQFSLDRKRRSHKHNQLVWFSLDRSALRFWLRLRLGAKNQTNY